MSFDTGCYFPIQCDHCGRELINMGCKSCSPLEPFSPPPAIQPTAGSPMQIGRLEARLARIRAGTNPGGFPKFSQLSVMTQPINAPPSPSRPRSPRKRSPQSVLPLPIWRFRFYRTGGEVLGVLDGKCVMGPIVDEGHHKPFGRRLDEGKEFMVPTKFEWRCHKWETEVPCDKETTETALFRRLCIYFKKFIEAMCVQGQQCIKSGDCICGGPTSSVTEANAKILGYELFYTEENDKYSIEVKAGPDVEPHIALLSPCM